ncbi:membrane protein [Neptunitalea sp. Y10]|uniref:Membrane protein n=2 Tax=Neptunitalea lumnitzerae TaxID=2965509 RepID=A0ABQ5MG63_9FLAO|nr:membrane protein [Neptunitalea sp. Y10]
MLAGSVLCTSCLGSYSAFNGLREWNSGVSDSKFVNNLLFWGLWIVPVYELFILGDTIIFNTIEFWSGSNPVAMEEGEVETQIVRHEGNKIKMTATQNKLVVEVLKGPKKGSRLDMVYNPETQTWSAVKPNGEVIELASYKDGFFLVHLPNGSNVAIDPNKPVEEGMALLNHKIEAIEERTYLASNE